MVVCWEAVGGFDSVLAGIAVGERSMIRWMVSPRRYAVRGKRRVATGRVERAMEKRVLRFGDDG